MTISQSCCGQRTPNMDRNIIISLLMALYGAAVTRAALLEAPENAAHFITQTVEFNCTAEPSNDTHPYDWQYNPMNQVPVKIVSNCKVNPAFLDKYVTEETADGGCRLILPNLLYDAAGTYTCQHGFDQGSADLIMLNNNSSCTFSPSDLMEGENITIFCYLNYNGTIAPLLDFRSETGSIINNATYQRFPTQVNIQVILPVYPPTTRAITGNTYFPPNSHIPFFFTWTLPTLYIQYPVKNIATTVSGEFCDEFYYANTTVLKCSAEGFPPPMFIWTDLDSGATYQTDTITLSKEGLNQFMCTATNDIRDDFYEVYDNVTVTLEPGFPDTCTPETPPVVTTEELTSPSTTTTTTPEPTTTALPITACGSVLHVGPANATNSFSIMCYIMRNDTDYLSTPCRELIQNLPPGVGNADDLVAKGGDFGCSMQTSVNWGSAPGLACFSQYQTGISLTTCSICPVLHVCIKLPASYYAHLRP